jgi:phospholipid/cholesterol/gamma-HCH transport system ATP-binding protein
MRMIADSETQLSPITSLRGVWKSFDGRPVLRGLDLDVEQGQSLVVMGPSGCGKSVMLKHIVGLLRPDAGEVIFKGTRVDQLSERHFTPIRRQIGFLFQSAALFDSMTVRDNVAFPLLETGQAGPDLEARVRRTLDRVGLADNLDQMPSELSGGMRKRVGLARAIVLEPEMILYDEPTTGLDPIRANVINDLIIRLQRELNITSVVVTHDLDSAFQVADRMVLLHDGRVRLDATPDEMRHSEDPVVRAFLEGREIMPHEAKHEHTHERSNPAKIPS